MKAPPPERFNSRVLQLATAFVSAPFVLAAGIFPWMRRMWQRTKTEKVLRAEDETRQSQVRRELRGLPPDHVQR